MPLLRVIVEEGQPLQAPCKSTRTVLVSSLNESNAMFPPSLSTAGLTYSFKILIISSSISV